MTPERDITLQDSGLLVAHLMKKGLPYSTDSAKTDFSVTLPYILYGPPDSQPPAWSNGQQYMSSLPQQCPDYGTVTVTSGIAYPFGCLRPFYVSDMSPATVLPGKTYTFVVQAHPQLQLYMKLVGTSSGTIVIPGFGILGLDPNPLKYTYIMPEAGWEGEWSIGINMAFSATIAQLAIEYVPLTSYSGPISYSKMNFMIEAASGSPTWPSTSEGDSRLGPQPKAAAGSFLVERRCSPYRRLILDGEPLAPE